MSKIVFPQPPMLAIASHPEPRPPILGSRSRPWPCSFALADDDTTTPRAGCKGGEGAGGRALRQFRRGTRATAQPSAEAATGDPGRYSGGRADVRVGLKSLMIAHRVDENPAAAEIQDRASQAVPEQEPTAHSRSLQRTGMHRSQHRLERMQGQESQRRSLSGLELGCEDPRAACDWGMALSCQPPVITLHACKERIIRLLGCEEKVVTESLKKPSRDPNIRNHSVGIVVACGNCFRNMLGGLPHRRRTLADIQRRR